MSSQSTEHHRREAAKLPPVSVAILTISDTRTEETDESGKLIHQLLEAAGHRIDVYIILKDDPEMIRETVARLAGELPHPAQVQAIITNGGTGIAPRDGTFEAVSELLSRELPGFGEIFRMLSYQEVGAAAMLSRAIAGLCEKTFVFCIPGSVNAVRIAMEKLIIPELAHLVWEANRKK
ncbi:MogA/MoaB family molybdenum cofactor biosynthesis protein [Candidatus Sumerlaeota bacterium]|nr:MogA/MoaB family molybdenum cofactor biosynthesis protein [Candidatus Sumerlaeota bacterium]